MGAKWEGSNLVYCNDSSLRRIDVSNSSMRNIYIRFMPSLEEVVINGCQLGRVEISHSPNLKRVVVNQCYHLSVSQCNDVRTLTVKGKFDQVSITSNSSLESINFDDGTVIKDLHILGYHIRQVQTTKHVPNELRIDLSTMSVKTLHLFYVANVECISVVSPTLECLTVSDCFHCSTIDLTACPRLVILGTCGSLVDNVVASSTVRRVHVADCRASLDLSHCKSLREVKACRHGELILPPNHVRVIELAEV